MTGRAGANDEIAVIGLARSGRAAAQLLASRGARVYASDAGTGASLDEAAELLRNTGVDADVGTHDLERIRRAQRVVVSPGVPPEAQALHAARDAGVAVVSEVLVALEAMPGTHVVAITGTNGKSTTTALVAHLLRALGVDAEAAGNIGLPLSEIAMRDRHPAWIALEVSSFQLHDMPGFSPAVGVLTNLSPDHLDRYRSVNDYYADKARMFASARAESKWVVNADDREAQRMTRDVAGVRYMFSLVGPADAWFDSARGELVLFDERLCPRDEFPLLGEHNIANALAAALAVAVADDAHRGQRGARRLADALKTFGGLPHRLEIVAERDGVRWINDSKATNVAAARTAIEAMTRPTILLLGGRHKGEPYAALTDPIRRHVRHVIAFGEAADLIVADLKHVCTVERAGSDFPSVVRLAREAARPGDAVLLAPACSSFDMFRDYEERGERFRQLARAA